MNKLLQFFQMDMTDPELMRAQFRSFRWHVPLLYGILVANTLAITFTSFDIAQPLKTIVSPIAICTVNITRAIWWSGQKNAENRPDAEIAEHLRRTCRLAILMTLIFNVWVVWVFQGADPLTRSNLTFFLALSQVSTVFCLMTLRAAAMSVSLVATVSFAVSFSWVGNGEMLPQALVLFCVCTGMAIVTYSFNHSFAEVIQSRQTLHHRQLETEKLSDENRRIAFTDPLTGLPNRRALMVRLDNLEVEHEARLDSLAVLFVDLDGFKDVNDQHGHGAGDALLRGLGEKLAAQCPDNGTLCRVGGDEFTILLEAVPGGEGAHSQALKLALRLLDEIALPVMFDKHWLRVSGSIGIAANRDERGHPRELLRRADLAMYNAKTEGKAQVCLYSEALDNDRLKRLEIEEEITAGLERGEFDVAYHPIVDAQTGAITSVEALLRWPRRPNGPLPPDDFIEIAETTGQIYALGLHVLERACREIAPFCELTLSVNVSPAQFHHPGFAHTVFDVLDKTGFPPHRLQLEITESYLLSNPELALNAVNAWKTRGISLALDDFGTGFTSIHYLRSYGFGTIKIDKTLVKGLEHGNKATMLVSGVIMVASALDMKVVAEGVETEDQAAILRQAGSHELQGYLYARPMPLEPFRVHFEEDGTARQQAMTRWLARSA